MRTGSIVTALAVLLASFAGSASWAQTPTGKPIRLGLIAEQTGPLAFYGAETARTAQLMVKQINEHGGLLGRPVELIVRDSKTTVNEAVRQARDLIYTENVDFLLQSINSAECIGIANVATQAKKLFISNCANDDLTNKDGGKYIFRIMNITTRTQGYAAADYVGNKLLARGNRYYTIAHDFAFGRLATAAFKTRIKEINPKAEFVGEAWPKMNEADYTPFITAMTEAKPDVVFFAWGVGAPFWQQSGPYKLPQKFAMVSSYWGGSDELQVLPKPSVPVGAVMGGLPYYAIDNATNSEFVDAFRKAYGKPPLTAAYFEFVTLQALKLGIEKAKTTDTDAVIKALEGLRFDSIIGPVTIRPFDHQGTTPYFTGVAAWDDGRHMGVLSQILKLPTEKYLPSAAEVEASRGKSK